MAACVCFGCAIIFVMIMMFVVNGMNTKVVANFHIMLALNYHDHRPNSFGVMLLASSLSDFSYALYRFE
jgi:hypothetical protein